MRAALIRTCVSHHPQLESVIVTLAELVECSLKNPLIQADSIKTFVLCYTAYMDMIAFNFFYYSVYFAATNTLSHSWHDNTISTLAPTK